MRLKFLIVFLMYVFTISFSFAAEVEIKPYFPEENANIELQGGGSGYSETIYAGRDGNKYSAREYYDYYNYDGDQYDRRTKVMFFAGRIYELFGLSTLPQYLLLDACKISGFSRANDAHKTFDFYRTNVVITKVDSTLKPINKFSEEQKEGLQEQLAKLHIVASLLSDLSLFDQYQNNPGTFIKGQDLYVVHVHGGFGTRHFEKSEYSPSAVDFRRFIEPQSNWALSKVFQKPFKLYTLNNTQKLIEWMDECWDEEKIDAVFKEAAIKDVSMLANLKLRFQNIKNLLKEIKINGYEVYDYKKISELLRKKATGGFGGNMLDLKDIAFEVKAKGPVLTKEESRFLEVDQQVVLCSYGSKVWLEFTNFESLISSKKSNKIIRLYVGDAKGKKLTDVAKKKAIEVFDPEFAFVFQKAAIRSWNSCAGGNIKDSVARLTEAIKAGYSKISYHLGFPAASLDYSGTPLEEFITILHEKYMNEVESQGRLITRGDLKKRKRQGFSAYYPDLFYLGDLINYKRPEYLDYYEYVRMCRGYIDSNMNCDKRYLSKYSDINFNICNEYNKILERIYPDDVSYADKTNKFYFSDFERKSVYGFRGEGRTLDEIYDAGGFWARYSSGSGYINFNENKEKFFSNDSYWQMGLCGNRLCPAGKGLYVSFSRLLSVTEGYGKNVYVADIEGGLSLPSYSSTRKVHDAGQREIAVPGGLGFENIIGVRDRVVSVGEMKHMFGPVYLKSDFFKDDPNNFWEILLILGGKPQCSLSYAMPKLTSACMDFLGGNKEKAMDFFMDKKRESYRKVGLAESEIDEVLFRVTRSDMEKDIERSCSRVLETSLGLEFIADKR